MHNGVDMSQTRTESKKHYPIADEVFTISSGSISIPIEPYGDTQSSDEDTYDAFVETLLNLLWRTTERKGERDIIEHGIYYDFHDNADEWSFTSEYINLNFSDGTGLCATWYIASLHWCECVIGVYIDELNQCLQKHGYQIRGTLTPQNRLRNPEQPLVYLRDTICHIEASDPPQVFNNDKELPWQDLTPQEQEQVQALLKSGRSGSSFCELYQGLHLIQPSEPQESLLSHIKQLTAVDYTHTVYAPDLREKQQQKGVTRSVVCSTETGSPPQAIQLDNGDIIAVGYKGWMGKWDGKTGEQTQYTAFEEEGCRELHKLPHPERLLFRIEDTTYIVWDHVVWQEAGRFTSRYGKRYCTHTTIWPDQPYIGIISDYDAVEIWSIETMELIASMENDEESRNLWTQTFVAAGEHEALTFSLDGDTLALVSLDTLRKRHIVEEIEDLLCCTEQAIVYMKEQSIYIYSLVGKPHLAIDLRPTYPEDADDDIYLFAHSCQVNKDHTRLLLVMSDGDEATDTILVWDLVNHAPIAHIINDDTLAIGAFLSDDCDSILVSTTDTIKCLAITPDA